MPKLKTHSGTKDRIRLTKTGKAMHGKAGGTHNLQKKTASRKRRIDTLTTMSGKAVKNIKKKLAA